MCAWGEGPDLDECAEKLIGCGYLVTTDGEEAKDWLEKDGYLVFRDDDEVVDFACSAFRNKTLKSYSESELRMELENRLD